ncbi:hypothetical protein PflCFBP13517_21505 [Pseudomonas fluorescens]|nr:hypothetical protein PflCFBP13517_21505 [Pseudomonas fluorescens]
MVRLTYVYAEAVEPFGGDEAATLLWGNTPEPLKFQLPQFQPGNQRSQVNNLIAVVEGVCSFVSAP